MFYIFISSHVKMLNICQIAIKIYFKPDVPTCNPSPVSLSQ